VGGDSREEPPRHRQAVGPPVERGVQRPFHAVAGPRWEVRRVHHDQVEFAGDRFEEVADGETHADARELRARRCNGDRARV